MGWISRCHALLQHSEHVLHVAYLRTMEIMKKWATKGSAMMKSGASKKIHKTLSYVFYLFLSLHGVKGPSSAIQRYLWISLSDARYLGLLMPCQRTRLTKTSATQLTRVRSLACDEKRTGNISGRIHEVMKIISSYLQPNLFTYPYPNLATTPLPTLYHSQSCTSPPHPFNSFLI